ncbi:MAG: hypothetical protein MHM6MM_002399 [Cercozoa sp. M6MM]
MRNAKYTEILEPKTLCAPESEAHVASSKVCSKENELQLKGELRAITCCIRERAIFSDDWFTMAASIEKIYDVARFEREQLDEAPDQRERSKELGRAQGVHTLWDQESSQPATMAVVEEGKLNVILRMLVQVSAALRTVRSLQAEKASAAKFHDVAEESRSGVSDSSLFPTAHSARGELRRSYRGYSCGYHIDGQHVQQSAEVAAARRGTSEREVYLTASRMEEHLSHLLRNCIAHIEALQLLDKRLLLEHCQAVFSFFLDHDARHYTNKTRSKTDADSSKSRTAFKLQRIFFTMELLDTCMRQVDELDEDVMVQHLQDLELPATTCELLTCWHALLPDVVLLNGCAVLAAFFQTEHFLSHSNDMTTAEFRSYCVQMPELFLSRVAASAKSKRRVRGLLQMIRKWRRSV